MRMKPATPRKLTSSDRININRFWNEMEEFRDGLESDKTAREAINTTQDCDEEAESVLSSTKATQDSFEEEEDDNLSCYCSGSSCTSSRSASVSSSYSMRDTPPHGLHLPVVGVNNHSRLPLPPDFPIHSTSLPRPPSIPNTKVMLDLLDRLRVSSLNTLV